MTTESYVNLGRRTAAISFLLGTGIFGLYYLTSSFELLFVGYGFIILTGIINLIVLISILLKFRRKEESGKKLLAACKLMLLNIPVMLIYCCIASILLNTMRINFTNSTDNILTKIHVVGCGEGYIDRLDIGQSKTVWVDIIDDCSISIEYFSNGNKVSENVAGYVTNSMGQKMQHNIGGENDEQF